ncbi:MAG TPA: hypothetical protein DEB73_02785 [Candidatus Magasanikbacteria bacterium]|nr:hypothetical protein [Candidatus Magasanikbacteria bacterium]HBX16008.1 hypothetical protein [Candidatus Magasanikbacteria bacterium]
MLAQVAGNGYAEESYDKVAILAESIRTMPDDDSLATESSLLLNGETQEMMEYSRWLYIILWLPMMLYACWAVPKVWIYRLCLFLFYRPSIIEEVSEDARSKNRAAWKEYGKRWLLGPQNALWLFDGVHWLGKMVRNGVTTSEALDGINAVPVLRLRGQLNSFGGRLVRFWLNQPDGQSVRNRLRITYKEILKELCRLWESKPGQQIHVLSLACGSAQATIEALAMFLAAYSDAKNKIELHLVDLSGSSLMRAVHLAKERGVQSHVFIHIKDVKSFVREQPVGRWDIVEMVGFLDYRPWKSAVDICREIRRITLVGGLFISAHIGPNPWSFVVRWVINWPLLIRRTIKKYRQILHQAGFAEREIKMLVEPHRIHPVGVCRKMEEF